MDPEVREHLDASSIADLATQALDVDVAVAEIAEVTTALWDKFVTEVRADPIRLAEHSSEKIEFDGAVMNYTSEAIGTKPANGWPVYLCLHGGGGGTDPAVNDDQYREMQTYYRGSITAGICVAVRGVADTWDVHFRPQSYPMYDRLIENLVAFDDADPDRVHLLGFSAGGDGVYQIATRMPDRFAAANMSSGHPNGVPADNLYNLPFTVQVGEYDFSYDRNRQGARYGVRLGDLATAAGGGYVHDTLVHRGGNHNKPWSDANADTTSTYEVYSDLPGWLTAWTRDTGDNFAQTPPNSACVEPSDPDAYADPHGSCITGVATAHVDANAVRRVSAHTRQPIPTRIIWDMRHGAPTRSGTPATGTGLFATARRPSLCYWLDVSDVKPGDETVIDVEVDRARNTVHVRRYAAGMRILLNADMVDLTRDVEMKFDNGIGLGRPPTPSLGRMAGTLLDRGDRRFIFPASTALVIDEFGAWCSST